MSEELKRDYHIGDEIGRGRFGVVHRCISSATGDILAVKSVDKRSLLVLADDAIDRECAERETKLHRLAADGNPGVVQIQDVYEDEDHLHVVMDLCEGGDLFDRISSARGQPMPEAAAAAVTVTAELMEAVSACHRRGVAYRDIKPDNILFDGDGALKLADFGSAACFDGEELMSGLVGTPYYVAPEVVAGREYGEKVDVWSAGVVLYLMLSGGAAAPFSGDTAGEVLEKVARANLRFPPRLFRDVSSSAKDLVRRMVCKDVTRRYSADQVLRHPWITSGGSPSDD